jgi:phage tail-like protein
MAGSNDALLDAAPPVGEARYFQVQIPEITVGVFARCGGLEVEYETLEYAEGGQNSFVHKLRGHIRYPNLLLSRGITNETGLLDWMWAVREFDQRPTVTLTLLNKLGKPQRSWQFSHGLPVRWVGPTLAETGEVASETLEIAHAGLLLN